MIIKMISSRKDKKSRSRVCKFWRSRRKVKYIEALDGVREEKARMQIPII